VSVEQAVAALQAGQPVVLPTDTVYGLCSSSDEESVLRLYELKGRPREQPTALLFADAARLLDDFPALDARIAGSLLPGPFTLIVPNPERRYRWLTGSRPEAIGVRVPELPTESAEVVDRVGCVAATSANLHDGPDPRSVDDVPAEIRAGCGAILDLGELPGRPSTVIDLTGPEPKILREGAVPAGEAHARVQAAQ
jgi:L-threonylcarbamoyladenylate synthase